MAKKAVNKKDDKKKDPKKLLAGKKIVLPGAKKDKAKKKKWSKVKVKEKLNNAAFWEQPLYNKMLKDIPNQRLVTCATVSERLKVNGSLARQAIRELLNKKKIIPVGDFHHHFNMYTRAAPAKAPAPAPPAK